MKTTKNDLYTLAMSEYETDEHDEGIIEEKNAAGMSDFRFNLDDLEEKFLEDEDFARCSEEETNDSDVYAELAQKEKDLLLAAELGKALLEKNEELSQKYEKLQEEFSQRVEQLEQEKHELKLRLERIDGSHELRVQELQADIHALRNELNSVKTASVTDSRSKRLTFVGLTEENQQLHNELAKVKSDQEDLVKELSNLRKQQFSRSISIEDGRLLEIEELREKLSRLEEEKDFLQKMVETLAIAKENLTKEVEGLKESNQLMQKDSADAKSQLNDIEEKLAESRESNLDLLNQLDELKMQASLDQTSRGSLFSELSDISLSMLDNDVSLCTKLGLSPSGKPVKQESSSHLRPFPSLHGNPRPLATSSSIGVGGLGSNKRQRQSLSLDSEESDREDLDYDDDVEDGPVSKAMSVYEQLEREEIVNAELRQEIAAVHNELVEFYEGLRGSSETLSSLDTDPVDSRNVRHGCLTSFVGTFKDVITDLLHATQRKNSDYDTDELIEEVNHLKSELYEAHKDNDVLKDDIDDALHRLKLKDTEIARLSAQLRDREQDISRLKEEKSRLLAEKGPDLALDMVYQQALKEKEAALKREYEISQELEKLKRDAGRLDHQLIEAIQQKIELSEQLEEWQYDMAALIDEQVQKQMRTAAKEHEARSKRKPALFSKGWNWTSNSR
ncbi:BICD family-like cargo adapter 1 [Nematostella vectensis]|uniref:BICD family-like cargo adapter 1 n=1 Tax=Nematostella vectensis TaxID=45351 RepID=UPI00207761DC|nr:BICD family-like cargo adapter 1 [Nematostella vectensis]